jgi:hypothetical protein
MMEIRAMRVMRTPCCRRVSTRAIGDGQRPTLIDLGDGHMVRAANAAQALEFAS